MQTSNTGILTEAQRDFDAKRYTKATEKFRAATTAEPNNALAWQGLARSLSALKRLDDAENAAQCALELDPKLSLPHNTLGLVYLGRKQYAQSEAEFKLALELEPNLAIAWVNLARVLASRGQLAEAEPLLHKAIQLDPKNPLAYQNLGWLYWRRHQRKKALPMFRAFFRRAPSFKTANLLLFAYTAVYPIVVVLVILALLMISFYESYPWSLLTFAPVLACYLWAATRLFRSGKRTQSALLGLFLIVTVGGYVNTQRPGGLLGSPSSNTPFVTANVAQDRLAGSDGPLTITDREWTQGTRVRLFSDVSPLPIQVQRYDILNLYVKIVSQSSADVKMNCDVRTPAGQIYRQAEPVDLGPNQTWYGRLEFDIPKSGQPLLLHCGQNLEVKIQ